MATHSSSNVHGNFQELRNMWCSKAQTQAQPVRPTPIPSGPHPEQREEQKQSSKYSIPVLKITNDTITAVPVKKEPPTKPNNERTNIFECVEKLPPIEEKISLPPPPPSIIFQHQAQSIAALEHTLIKMSNNQKKNIFSKDPKNNGIHLWHIARHVFRSGLILNRTRRASDSILPLLMKTHQANAHSRKDSMDSTFSQTPFESLIDYVTHNKENDIDSLTVPIKRKRSASDSSDCIRRNKLDDSVFQYEMILRHLKNYEQFMATYPVSSSTSPSISSKQQEKSTDSEPNNPVNEIEVKFLAKTLVPNRQTQSLSRNVGRTFSEFMMNDLFLSPSSRSSFKEQPCLSISHASSQTDLLESNHDIKNQTNDSNLISNEEAKAVLNELDTVLDNSNQESFITPNTAINVVVLNSPLPPGTGEILSTEKPLMQRLFEGKKTGYSPNDHNMKPFRLPEEMMPTYEIAKKKCFFDSEELLYTTKMIKISRRGYTQHLRILCITTERVYNITKKNPYPKEGLFLEDILGITCTPYKDGFMCIHTREVYEDRGDWLVIVDHPCEFITQLFMVLGRENNDDHFLKFETNFKHCRRCYGEGTSSDCTIEIRIADSFLVKKAEYDHVIIFTP